MTSLLVSLGVVCSGGMAAAIVRRPRAATVLGAGSAMLGSVLGALGAARAVIGAPVEALEFSWGDFGRISIAIDPLSAFFLLPIFVLSGVAALYGAEYLKPRDGASGANGSPGLHWLSFNLLCASMALVVVARDAVLFLVAWESMALASFFLVTRENDRRAVRDAGWLYLAATHVGTAFLFPLFLILSHEAHTTDFSAFPAAAAALQGSSGVLFLIALVGFGTKAGILPLHIWLPEAHPAAPSHVSAVMSGVMIKTGIYGLVRMLTFLGPPQEWWGWALVALGCASGVGGVLFALAQHDLKRLLAYHSVENIGIILLGIGLGILGVATHVPALAVLGFAGGLLHVVNHALFKGLLFLGAGSVLHAVGSGEIDRMGGLLKRMPWTGVAFLVGAVAICGLPPLNGFASEFLVYAGAFGGAGSPTNAVSIPALAALVGLALIGGLAAACFAKAFGVVFLGEPREELASHPHDPGLPMRLSMALLAGACALVALLAPWIVQAMAPAVSDASGLDADLVAGQLAAPSRWLGLIVGAVAALVALVLALIAWRARLLAGRIATTGTWDCGYARPTARMQYTASSFAQPITAFFGPFLRTRAHAVRTAGYFPPGASHATETPDVASERVFAPILFATKQALARLHWMQQGGVHLYVLYLAVTLLVLLVWKL